VTGDDRLVVPFQVDRVEHLSGDRHLYGEVRGLGAETRVIARLPATVTADVEPGQEHQFAVHADRLRFFDADSGERTEPVSVRTGS
jgi:hypothetical protein